MNRGHHRAVCLGLAVLMALVMLSLPQQAEAQTVKATKLTLNKTDVVRYITRIQDDPLNEYDTHQIVPKIMPASASANQDKGLISYESRNPNVADVDQDGNVRARGLGKTQIVVKLMDGSGLVKRLNITVRALPVLGVEVVKGGVLSLQPGESIRLDAIVQPETVRDAVVSYRSSNSAVASVTSYGQLTAKKPGTVKITATARSGGRKGTVQVTVGYRYRLFSVSNGNYRHVNKLANYRADVKAIERIFDAARFDGGFVKREHHQNLTVSGMRNLLKRINSSGVIGPNDVTIFYYSGHGADESYGEGYNGALVGVEASGRGTDGMLPISELVQELAKIPGQVVVILDSCYSGELVTGKSLLGARMAQVQTALTNQSVISQFKKMDTRAGGVTSKALNSESNARFHVLTSCAADELAYAGILPGWSEGKSFMTHYIQQATVGGGGLRPMPADTDGDGAISLNELYRYVSPLVLEMSTRYGYAGASNMQVWPENDATSVFAIR